MMGTMIAGNEDGLSVHSYIGPANAHGVGDRRMVTLNTPDGFITVSWTEFRDTVTKALKTGWFHD